MAESIPEILQIYKPQEKVWRDAIVRKGQSRANFS